MKPSIASDLLHRDVSCASLDWSVEALAEFLDSEDIHGAPVVDGTGHLVGVVSRTDLARAFAEEGLATLPRPTHQDTLEAAAPERRDEIAALTVGEIMSTEVVTAGEDASAGELAELMRRHSVHRVVIVEGDAARGIVSITDLLPVLVSYERELFTAERVSRAATRRPSP